MSANYNKVFLIGNLTRDPELKHLPSGVAVATFSIAVSRKWKDDAGQQKEEVSFVDCTAFDRRAEAITKYVVKGSSILVEGRLRQDRWEDKTTGKPRSALKVQVEQVQFLSWNQDRHGDAGPATEAGTGTGGGAVTTAKVVGKEEDEVPF